MTEPTQSQLEASDKVDDHRDDETGDYPAEAADEGHDDGFREELDYDVPFF